MKRYGLIGKKLSHSFSKNYFTEKFKTERIEGRSYELFELENIELFAELVKQDDLCGLNVTIPYKQDVMPFLDEVDARVQRIGAVNTIAFKDGKLIGHNTDYDGFYYSLLEILPHKPKLSALILGTGGASLAVRAVLEDLNIPYQLVSRTEKESCICYEQVNKACIEAHRLIINTTPLGTYPNIDTFPDIDYEAITGGHFVYDLVYNPKETSFMKKSADQDAKVMNGEKMLVLQAEYAWKIWTGDGLNRLIRSL